MKQILNAFPSVLFTPKVLDTMQQLFLNKALGGRMSTRQNHSAQATDKTHQNFDYSKGEILMYLSHVKTGKGAGPYADPTDCIQDLAVFTHGRSSQTPKN
jgi:hypothetical protein